MMRHVSAQQYRPAIKGEMWECLPVSVGGPIVGRSSPRDGSADSIAQLASASLIAPLDFPPMTDALVPGDQVALAVDPNVPQVVDVITGVALTVAQGGAAGLSVVMWEEASDAMLEQVRKRLESLNLSIDVIHVTRHQPHSRPDLRYVAADNAAEPVYLARELVDADFTLPIVAARRGDAVDTVDKNSIFPMFADAATQARYQLDAPESVVEAGWLLGVQLVMLVSSDASGAVSRIISGTPDAVRNELRNFHVDDESETILKAGVVIAALDGDSAMQSWCNVARAALAASRHVMPDGAIVIWSRLSEPPPPVWQRAMIEFDPDAHVTDPVDAPEMEDALDEDRSEEDGSDESAMSADDQVNLQQAGQKQMGQRSWANILARIVSEHRVWLHSEVSADDVELLGMGVVDSIDQLTRLATGMDTAGVLRAAQFHSESNPRENAR